MASDICASIDVNSRHVPLKGPEKLLPHLPLGLCLRVPLLVGYAESKCTLVDDGVVDEFVSLGVKGPCFLSKVELLGKSYTECLESSHAGHLPTQIEKKVHFFDGDDQCREALLLTVRGHSLNGKKNKTSHDYESVGCMEEVIREIMIIFAYAHALMDR